MKPGDKLRVQADPGRVGVFTGITRQIGPNLYLQVSFPDTTEYKQEKTLELVPSEKEDMFELVETGRFGRARDLRGSITHIRLNGRIGNLIYSLNTTNTDYYPHQFKPVLNFLKSPSNNMLIADEVGLGKTIEAGLIWTEIRSRYDYRRLVVICPAMLRDKWKMELENKFGIPAILVGRDDMLEHLESAKHSPLKEIALIGSYQGLRPGRGWKEEEDLSLSQNQLAYYLRDHDDGSPLIDMVIMDEAHYMRNPHRPTSDLGDLFRSVSHHTLLLSATPIHLRNRDLYQLMNLIDPETFQRETDFDIILSANEPIVELLTLVTNGKITAKVFLEKISDASNSPLLMGNRQLALLKNNPPSERDLRDEKKRVKIASELENINILGRAISRTRKRDVIENNVLRDPHRQHVKMNEYEAELYENVTNLVREYAARNSQYEGFLMVMPQRQVSSSMAAALKSWRERSDELMSVAYEDLGYDDSDRGMGPLVTELVTQAENLGDLDKLIENDTKYLELIRILNMLIKDSPKEKIILFSYFKPTLYYLKERLMKDGFRPVVLTGGQGMNKTEIIMNFEASLTDQILISTEVASEGVDLQFSRFLINYDLPWNPMRIEQRIGRIDRIGQKAPKITIWNLFYSDTIDDRIYTRLYERLDIFQRSLGGMEAILGEKIQQLTGDLIRTKLTPEQESIRVDQTFHALANVQEEEERLEENASSLIAHGEYLLRQVKAARDLERTISSNELVRYTRDFFLKHYQGSTMTHIPQKGEYIYEVNLSVKAIHDLQLFMRNEQLGTESRFSLGDVGNIFCEFSNKMGGKQPKHLERVNQWHPLVRFVADSIRTRKEVFYPAVALKFSTSTDARVKPGNYFFILDHWSASGVQTIDHLYYYAINMDTNTPLLAEEAELLVTRAAFNGTDLQILPEEMQPEIWSKHLENCMILCDEKYDEYISKITRENEDRADIQLNSLKQHFNIQMERLNNEIEKLEREGKQKGADLRKGKAEKLKRRVEQQVHNINEHRSTIHDRSTINTGIIRVHEGVN